MAADEVDQVGAFGQAALVDRQQRQDAVGHVGILAQVGDLGAAEEGLLGGVQSGAGGAGGIAGAITGLGVPADIGQVVGGARAEQLDHPVVAGVAGFRVQLGLG